MDEILQSHFLNLFSFALADSAVDPKEAEQLYQIALEKGVSEPQVNYLIDNPHKVRITIPTTKNEIAEQLYDIALIVLADGKVDLREITALRKYIEKFVDNEEICSKLIEELIDSVKNNLTKEMIINQIIKQLR